MHDRTRKVVDAAELVPGDIALVEEGERIAADMRLIWARSRLTFRRSPARRSRRCARRSTTTATVRGAGARAPLRRQHVHGR